MKKIESYKILIVGLFLMLIGCKQTSSISSVRAVFTVSHNYGFNVEKEMVYLDINQLEDTYGTINTNNFVLTDLRNNKQIELFDVEVNGANKGKYLAFEFIVDKKEPLRSFAIKSVEFEVEYELIQKANVENKLTVTFLTSANKYLKNKPINWPETIANSFINLYTNPKDLEAFSPYKWTYTNGFFTNALCELHLKTGNSKYLDYTKSWIDVFVASDGTIEKYVQQNYRLDDILPGRSVLYLLQHYPEEKYKIAANNFIHHIENQPKTSDGGYWHKKVYEHQMWLDGIYMGDVFTTQYAQQFSKPELFDEAIHQIELIYKHTKDSKTGLLYHGWDESKNDIWANSETGTSPEFWGRGIGWYMMALVDVLDYIPKNHTQRPQLIKILQELSASLANYEENGLWYQVIDKAGNEGNWIETSCSAMFAYAYAKGAKNGYLQPEYLAKAKKTFNALIDNYVYFDNNGAFYLTQTVKVGTLNFKHSDASYTYYVNVDRRINDFKGIGAILYLSMALEY